MSLPKPFLPPALPVLKLTRVVEADPRHAAIEALLKKDCRPLWEKSFYKVPHIPFLPALESCLRDVHSRKKLERGVEQIERLLSKEQKGLAALKEKQGTEPFNRISRLFIVANDGSERFYRACEKVLLQNSDRLLLLHVDASSDRLAQCILGVSDKPLKALLVSDRDAVSGVLFSLVGN